VASSVGNGFDVQKAFHSPQHYYENFSECDVMTMFDILAYLSQLMTAFTSHLALFLALVSQDGSVIMKGGVTHVERFVRE
jgi:hypothetical protein